jgi:O-antigen ligase
VHKLLKKEQNIFVLLASLFIILNSLAIAFDFQYLNALPVLFAIIWLAIRSIDKLVFTIVFFTPLSIPLSEYIDAPIDMFIPTEPLLVGLLLLFILLLPTKKYINKTVLNHPISISIIIHLTWMLVTTLTSTMPVVSIKFFTMRLWFVVAFYYLMVLIISSNIQKNTEKLVWLYAGPMIIVIIYSLYRHITFGIFESKVAHWASNPFYKDHTIYGAVLALLIPILFASLFKKTQKPIWLFLKIIVFGAFTVAVIASYSRAAWVSLVAALILFIVLRLKIQLKHILFFSGVILLFFALSWNNIMLHLEQNRQESATDNIGEHIQSISNISNDASNLERINRWSSAFKMFADKPFFGFGPGTYMFQYGKYQMSYEKTIISTNAGDMGNAHSEYFGPLSEQGILGMLTFLGIAITIVLVGIKLYYRLTDKTLKLYLMGALLGVFTYILHGTLNNFLDTDKASAPFWGLVAIIVAIDLYDKKQSEKKEVASNETQSQKV